MIVQWMLYASAVAALLALAAWALEAVMRPRRLATRWGWLAAVILSLALPAARLARPAPAAEAEREDREMGLQSSVVKLQSPIFIPPTSVGDFQSTEDRRLKTDDYRPPLLERLEAIAPALWLGGTGALGVLLLAGWAQLLRRSRRWRSASIDGERVLLSADTGPAVIGVVRSSIVLPEWVLAMEAGERRLILQHERAHIAARDPIVVALGMAAVLLTPWNAPLWWMLRRLRLAIETDCDARVLRRQAAVGGYARLLLSLAERSAGDLPAGAPAFAEPLSFLERRIRAMTTPIPSRRRGLAAGLLAAVLIPALAFAIPAPPSPRVSAAATLQPISPVTVRGTSPGGVVPSVPVTAPAQGAAADTVEARYDPTSVEALAQREYPADMRQRNIAGTVTLRFILDSAGRPRDIESISQSGLEFVEPARRVVQQLQFSPARFANQPVEQVVPFFQIRFRASPPAPSTRGEPSNEEVLLRAAIQRLFPELLREESVRPQRVYLVVDERGDVLHSALDWVRASDDDYGEQLRDRFPQLPRTGDAVQVGIPARVRTGIPGGRDIEVYWAVWRTGSRPGAEVGPYPLGAVATRRVPAEVVERALRERYPDVLQRASSETIWFVGHADGEIIATGRGAESAISARFDSGGPGTYGIYMGQPAAEGGHTRVHWIVPGRVAPSDPNVVSGSVRDAAGNPIAGALVLFRDIALGATTDSEGRFAFRAAGVRDGRHAIFARHPSGTPAAAQQVTWRTGGNATVDFVLPAR